MNLPAIMKTSLNKLLVIFLFISLCASMAVHFTNNSFSGILGKDESLYISLAKGHYSHTPIDALTGTLGDALIKGTLRTSDPPGFLFLLHFWEYISFSEAWLRLLPYLFFATSIVTIIRIGAMIKLPLTISVIIGYLPLASYLMVNHAIELRAYGMELCLTYLMIYSALNIIIMIDNDFRPKKGKWITLSLIMAAGLSSRFSFVISSCAMYSTLWICILRKYKTPTFNNYLVPLTISSFSSLLFFILFIGMKFFLPTMDAVNSVPADFEMYAIPGTFFNKISYLAGQICNIPSVLFSGPKISSPSFYLIIITLLSGAVLLLSNYMARGLRNKKIVARLKSDSQLYLGLILFPLISLFLSMLLAFVGLHPFSIASRLSLYLHPAFHLFIIGILKISIPDESFNPEKPHLFATVPRCAGLSIVIGLLAMLYGALFASHIVSFRMGGPQFTDAVIKNMLSENEIKNIDAWFISVGAADSFKYHALYGKLKNKLSPNASIIIENRPASIKNIDGSELKDIYASAARGSKIAMVLGHVSKDKAKVYIDKLLLHFTNVQCGKHENSNEQVCYAVR